MYTMVYIIYGISMSNKKQRLTCLKQIADYASYSPNTIKKFILEKNFPAKKIGRFWVSNKDEIDKWFDDI